MNPFKTTFTEGTHSSFPWERITATAVGKYYDRIPAWWLDYLIDWY